MNGSSRWSRSGTVALALDETLRLPRGRKGIRARVERGTVLVTQAGDPYDHVLEAGDEVWLPPAGLAIAWALTPALISVREPAADPARVGAPCEHVS